MDITVERRFNQYTWKDQDIRAGICAYAPSTEKLVMCVASQGVVDEKQYYILDVRNGILVEPTKLSRTEICDYLYDNGFNPTTPKVKVKI